MGVSDDHYTIQKASSVGDGLVDSSQDSLVADSIAAHDFNVSPTEVENTVVPPSDVANADSIVARHVVIALEGGCYCPSFTWWWYFFLG